MSAVLIDLGGTDLRRGIWGEASGRRVIHSARIRNFEDGSASAEIWQEIIAAITEFSSKVCLMVAPGAPIVISFPGPVVNRSRILDAPTVAGATYEFPDLRNILRERTGRGFISSMTFPPRHGTSAVASRAGDSWS